MNNCKFLIVLCLFNSSSYSQINATHKDDSISQSYTRTFKSLESNLVNNKSLAHSVFLVESGRQSEFKSYDDYEKKLDNLVDFVNYYYKWQRTNKYRQPDSVNYLKNQSIYYSLFDTLSISFQNNIYNTKFVPFSYSFENILGGNVTDMFVTKLLSSKKGDCHSLSYLYKIIADRIGAKCWLALAPNHIYIKNFSQQYGWYNTELTSRSFPSDAWIMASGYISADAIRSNIYMDTLSNQQSIGLCVLDLAKAYEYETKNYYDGFILKCCDLVLQYHATNPMALLLKAETLKKVYLKQKKGNAVTAKQAYDEMEAAYITLAKLHYREMPKEMYDKWVKQMQEVHK
ncbi:hypothetical protein [Terrimonas sp.]|uniref:hypothetical protein n=1 Tax=Terrimonas sp. TaxID=1914338 RepID=UPI0010573743|nr:hypothetical protein [Terrimonas sp.]